MNVFFKGVYALKAKRSSISSARVVVLETRYVKVGQSSNLLYQGFAEKYFLCIYLNSKAKYKKKKTGRSVCISMSNGAMKLTHLHLNPTFMLFA